MRYEVGAYGSFQVDNRAKGALFSGEFSAASLEFYNRAEGA
ncbi:MULTISPECIES: hypothetical protein [unclassified Fibrobacter]|nr:MULTISPECIES: hypothetical protein [Fibrobacter]MDO4947063.1 hypothetical protein [Fibrobacter sp.]